MNPKDWLQPTEENVSLYLLSRTSLCIACGKPNTKRQNSEYRWLMPEYCEHENGCWVELRTNNGVTRVDETPIMSKHRWRWSKALKGKDA